jgi:hypothetical protein
MRCKYLCPQGSLSRRYQDGLHSPTSCVLSSVLILRSFLLLIASDAIHLHGSSLRAWIVESISKRSSVFNYMSQKNQLAGMQDCSSVITP